MTVSAHIIDKQKIKQIDDFLSGVASLKKEMAEQQAASLWVQIDDLADVFRLQDIFGLHPLAVDAVIHQNHPSKIEEYDTYLFTIIDGIRIEEKGGFAEDDLYIFLGKRWIITINLQRSTFRQFAKENSQHSIYVSKTSIIWSRNMHGNI
jgi:Mg2+ and Co2+ transporter CorA